MHQEAVENLKKKMKGVFLNCQIKENWPQFESFSKHLEPFGNALIKSKKEWLDINDVFSIFYDFVYDAINSKVEKDEKLEGILWDLLGDDSANQLFDEIMEYFISIPREYDIYIPLPKITENIPANMPRNMGANIAANSDGSISFEFYEEADKVPGYTPGVLGLLEPGLELNKLYLRQRLSGYSGNRLENALNKKAINNFKIVLQQGIFKKLFIENPDDKIEFEFGLMGGYYHHQIPKVHLMSFDILRNHKKTAKIELPLDFSKWINSIYFNWMDVPLVKAIKDGKFDQLFTSYFKNPMELTRCDDEEAIRVKSAIQWCFDSYITENQTLSFLQVCIGLEALLGNEKYKGGLTDLLADRCAYLISKDIKGRKTIKNNFEELYDIRSKLVHGNATELSSNQKYYLNWGRTVLGLAIFEEIKHLFYESGFR